jgi:hypothetical protein
MGAMAPSLQVFLSLFATSFPAASHIVGQLTVPPNTTVDARVTFGPNKVFFLRALARRFLGSE